MGPRYTVASAVTAALHAGRQALPLRVVNNDESVTSGAVGFPRRVARGVWPEVRGLELEDLELTYVFGQQRLGAQTCTSRGGKTRSAGDSGRDVEARGPARAR